MWLRCETPYLSCQLLQGFQSRIGMLCCKTLTILSTVFRIPVPEREAVLWNSLTILSTVFRDFSSGKCCCVLKHPDFTVRWCSKGSNSGKMDCVVIYPNYLYYRLCSGIPAPERWTVLCNTLIILSTVFRDSSTGKMDCVVQYPNYTIDCVQGFQHRKGKTVFRGAKPL